MAHSQSGLSTADNQGLDKLGPHGSLQRTISLSWAVGNGGSDVRFAIIFPSIQISRRTSAQDSDVFQ
jgi:hypothetical protein